MTTKNTKPELAVPDSVQQLPYGAEVMFFEKGIEAYEAYGLNTQIEIKLPNGMVQKATVRSTQVAPLIELIVSNGHRYVSNYGQAYTAGHLVKSLTKDTGVDVLDVTKLYTGVLVFVDNTVSPTP